MHPTLALSVRQLVQAVLRHGDLVGGFSGSGRAVLGARLHRKLQRQRPDTYQAEVPVTYAHVSKRLTVHLGGRIDGVFTLDDGVAVEEIKTTARDLDDPSLENHRLHWGQLTCYAFMLAADRRLSRIDTRLTYISIATGEIRTFERRHSFEQLQAFFEDLMARYIARAEMLADWYAQRDASADDQAFPFSAYRKGQREMAVAVYRTIQNGGRLFVEAATGIGKTMAVVFPAVKLFADLGDLKLFYLTARTTGRRAAEQAFDRLHRQGLAVKVLSLTAKDKICLSPGSACHPEECEFARGHFDRVGDALLSVFPAPRWSAALIEETSREHRVCPFELSLDLAEWADCVICDYNYAFDPRVVLRRFFQEGSGRTVCLVDEAHNLVDRSREMYSADITKSPFLAVRRSLKDDLPSLYKAMGAVNREMLKVRKACDARGGEMVTDVPPDALVNALRRFLALAERWLVKNRPADYREALLELYFQAFGWIRISEMLGPAYATCIRREQKDLRIRLFCMDPSAALADILALCHAGVFFSATLSPLNYYRDLLGGGPDIDALRLPSPFPRDRLGVFIARSVSTLYRDREHTKGRISRLLVAFAGHRKGKYLFFFPSYVYMEMVFEAFASAVPDAAVQVQRPEMTESERAAFLRAYTDSDPAHLIGFAVMGGIFGEAIDLVGDQLTGAAIVGVGLPGISLEQDLIRQHFQVKAGLGFEYAYQYPGINRVLQAAGRVIRSHHDRGVVLMIDRRYATRRYARLLPSDWQVRYVRTEQELTDEMASFWARQVTAG